jgi:energy-coupling factor transporter ATP-binding protein EcfA2
MSMNVVEASGLGKRYGGMWALRECTLAVPAGHVAAPVGPNGAGKTTLLNLAAPIGPSRSISPARPSPPAGTPPPGTTPPTPTSALPDPAGRTWRRKRDNGVGRPRLSS